MKNSGKKSIFAIIAALILIIGGRVIYGSDLFEFIENDSDFSQTATAFAPQTQKSEYFSSEQSVTAVTYSYVSESDYHFRNEKLLLSHYQKHGIEMGFSSKEDYEEAAAKVITSTKALSKHEKEDNDMVYFIPSTGEIVFLSTDGFIRTYFIADEDYYGRQ